MSADPIRVRISDPRTAYVYLPGYRFEFGIVKKTISLEKVINDYKGPMVNLDFDNDSNLIGIEILVWGNPDAVDRKDDRSGEGKS